MAKPKVLIVFYSRNGSTETLARAIAEGAETAGAEVRLRRVREFVSPEVMALAPGWAEAAGAMNEKYEAPTPADAEWADAIVFGSPTRFGNVSAELKSFVDGLGGLWFQGKLNGKVGSAFVSTSTVHGGNESTILTMFNFMSHFGLIIVPPGFRNSKVSNHGTPYGASAVVGHGSSGPVPEEIEVAQTQGQVIAETAAKLIS